MKGGVTPQGGGKRRTREILLEPPLDKRGNLLNRKTKEKKKREKE